MRPTKLSFSPKVCSRRACSCMALLPSFMNIRLNSESFEKVSTRCLSSSLEETVRYMKIKITLMESANTQAYQSVSRVLRRFRQRSFGSENIANPSNGMNAFYRQCMLNFIPEATNKNIDDICLRIEPIIPYLFKNDIFRQYPFRISHK